MTWWQRFRKYWFPTKEEQYAKGRAFAEKHFANVSGEDEFDHLYESLPFNNLDDPFDKAILDYAREVNWGAPK